MAVEFVDAERIAELNATWRGKAGPTDVLSFPVDEDDEDPSSASASSATSFICPEHTEDLVEAVVHGVLHLTGMDHETDDGEMLAAAGGDHGVAAMTHAIGLRRARGAAERRQVDAGQRDGRPQGGDRLRQAADHAARDPRRGHGAGPLPARADRPAGRPAPARRADRADAAPRGVRAGARPTPRCSSSTATRASAAPGDRFIAEALGQRQRAGRDRGQQGRPARTTPAPSQALPIAARARAARGRGLPDLRAHRQGRPGAARLPRRRCCPRARSTSRPRTSPTSPRT